MEHFIYDNAVDDVLDIIESRMDYYDCLIMADKVDSGELEIIEELEVLRDIVSKLKYYQEWSIKKSRWFLLWKKQ